MWKYDLQFIEDIELMTGGRIKIELYEPPALVATGQMADALKNDVIQMAISFPNMHAGKNTAFSLFTQHFMGETKRLGDAWMFSSDGRKYMDQLYSQIGIKAFPFHNGGPEISAFTKTPIHSLDDWRALESFRTGPGLQNEISTRFGLNVVWVAGVEVYSALERGTIEGAKWGPPSETWGMKFHEVCPYLLFPSWALSQFGGKATGEFNLDRWNSLSPAEQRIFESAAYKRYVSGSAEAYPSEGDYLQRYKDYGCTFTKLSGEDMAEIMDAAVERLLEMGDENPLFKEILMSQVQFQKDLQDYLSLSDWPDLPEGYPPFEKLL